MRLDPADRVVPRVPAEREERVQLGGREDVAEAGVREIEHRVVGPPADARRVVTQRKYSEAAHGSMPSA
jgi:hypothetical protein